MMVLPGRSFRKYFARVVLPEQVAPLEERKAVNLCPGGLRLVRTLCQR